MMGKIETRDRIIDAALEVAAKKGFNLTTTAEIARKAKVSEGLLYKYFKSKDELCLMMVEKYATAFRVELVDHIRNYASSREKIEVLIHFHFTYFTKAGNIFQVIHGRSGETSVQMGTILKVTFVPYVKLIEEIIRIGIKKGEFRSVNPKIAASSLLSVMQVVILLRHFRFARYTVNEAMDSVTDIFFKGILPLREPEIQSGMANV
jgi:TetR/AcrR family fatty acid metabolism transcriptional regulator